MLKLKALLVLTLLLVAFTSTAQDTLVYRSGQTIIGQVEEVGTTQIRYRTSSGANSVLVVAEKIDLVRVVLQNGQEFTFNTSEADQGSNELRARKNLLTLDVIAPALDHLTVGYQRAFTDKFSLRVRLGYIGLWRSEISQERILTRGFMLRAGPMFKFPTGTKKYPSMRDTHPLSGWYLSPELLMSYYRDPNVEQFFPIGPWPDPSFNFNTTYEFRSSAALNLTIGRQVLLGDRITFDIHGGLGYGVRWINGTPVVGNTRSPNVDTEYQYSHLFFGQNTPLCANGGISFGYAFK